MAMRTARQRNQLPPCYYEGFLEKRSFKDKTSRKLWTCLCGNTLFFFNEKKDCDYIEKLDLSGLISITDDSSPDRNLDAARLILQMEDGNIKFTVPSAEARELWKGFIHSVTELSVPSSINLLPGQLHMLKEAVEQEKLRIKSVLPPPTPPPPPPQQQQQQQQQQQPNNSSINIGPLADMPACYHNMSRLEAELLLEREAKRGNLLLRPGSNGNSFSVTTRQELDGSLFSHYRVMRKQDGGFSIDVDEPVHCATLHDVINHFVEQTGGVLIPLIIEEPYEKSISFIRSDNENGEKSVQQALLNSTPPSVPPKPVTLKLPNPEPIPVSLEEGSIYQNDNSLDKYPKKKAMMPPTSASRKLSSSLSTPSSANNPDVKMRVQTESLGMIPMAAMSELKLKLEKKLQGQE